MFKNNVGSVDRILRIIIGVALLAAWAFTGALGNLHWVLLIGIVPIATALMGSCPLYSILGLSTCPVKKA